MNINKANAKDCQLKSAKSRSHNANERLIKGRVLSEIRDALTLPDTRKKVFFQEFVQSMMKAARKNPDSWQARLLFENILQDDILTALDAETEKNLAKDYAFLRFRLSQQLNKKQNDVFIDGVSRFIATVCGRRSGKTELNARLLDSCCVEPNSPTLYINLTFTNAIIQCYDKCIKAANDIDLPIARESKADGIIEFANGSSITFKGNATKAEADKSQGFKYRLIIIDEIQSQKNLDYLVDQILMPTMADFTDSKLYVTGTPPRRPNTWIENIWTNSRYTKHSWNMYDNPYIPDPDGLIDSICESKGISRNSNFIRREIFGEWLYDTEAMLVKTPHYFTDIPKDFKATHIYIGADFGWSAYNAIIGVACNHLEKRGFVFCEYKFNHANVTEIIDTARKALDEGKSILLKNPEADISNIGIYGDYSDVPIIYEMSTTYNMPAYKCYKYDKAMALAQLSDDLNSGRIQIRKDSPLDEEFKSTLYKRDADDNLTDELDDTFHPDALFALLYASRQYMYDWGVRDDGNTRGKKL